ncbi:hypothetical protein JCM24511_00290 [Saitozyma sp. JCM 24511]|nr:hypothetical protein JCM24511_00290 [Saitozyma sp. JCM 24511]
MPIAIDMNGVGPSPTSPRMTKAAFFRARSPPVVERQGPGPGQGQGQISPVDMLGQRLDMGLRIDPNNGNGNPGDPSRARASQTGGFVPNPIMNARVGGGVGGPSQGRPSDRLGSGGPASTSTTAPQIPSVVNQFQPSATAYSSGGNPDSRMVNNNVNVHPQMNRRPTNKREGELSAAISLAQKNLPDTPSTGEDTARFEERLDDDAATAEGSQVGLASGLGIGMGMGMNGQSDEMMLALLASQAAVDCERLPIGAWEDVESWKKASAAVLTTTNNVWTRDVGLMMACRNCPARTLQKLNNQNKRMSKQTMESLEQSEKRVEAAEKEVLVLRDREAGLRRQLMEHWSGVMAWEVRRLERLASEAQARAEQQVSRVQAAEAADAEWRTRAKKLEEEVGRGRGRVTELEGIVVEMGRRERAMEEEVRELDRARGQLEQEKEGFKAQLRSVERDRASWDNERTVFGRERDGWERERRAWASEKETHVRDLDKARAEGTGSAQDRAAMERVRAGLGSLLGRTSMVSEAETETAFQEVRALVERREKEVGGLRDEMREVNMGLEEEVRRVSADRDVWKGKAEKADQTHRTEITALEKQTRSLNEQISDLSLRNESLSTSLNAAQSAVTSMNSTSANAKSLQTKVDALTAELDSIAGQFTEVWSLLPPLSRRVEASLANPSDGTTDRSIASPTKPVDFKALEALYAKPNSERFGGIDEMVRRIRGMVDDGKIMVERMVRMEKEKEVHKGNAAKAKKLVEDSRKNLETYQQQVAVLEDRLAKSGSSESHFLEELNSLRSALDAASISKRNLELRAAQQSDTVDRLQKANDTLSARALEIADEAAREKDVLAKKYSVEMDGLRKQVKEVEEGADEERSRGQAQRIQLLDELNSLQAEVGELRKQLRQVRGGTPGK